MLLLLACVQTVVLRETGEDTLWFDDSGDTDTTDTDTTDTDTSDTDTPSIAERCEDETRREITLPIEFPAREPGCDWGENGNLDPAASVVTARAEEYASLLLKDVVICDLVFDFEPDDDERQNIRYDDNFFLTFDDVVLAASYAPMVERFDAEGTFRLYEWDEIAGYYFSFDEDIPTYCLGEAEGLSACEVPPPEEYGPIAIELHPTLVNGLAQRAHEESRYEFGFITLGDDEPYEDCSHGDFEFRVEVSYIVD